MLSDIDPTPKHVLTLSISADQEFLTSLLKGYKEDTWTRTLISATPSMPNLKCQDGLWFLDNCLIIPNAGQLWETLFHLAHDNLGHFGFDKLYEALHHSYFWPRMCKELETAYIPSCIECQRNKSATTKPLGPLHPLPVPNGCCDSVAIDFIGPLPPDNGFDCITTFTDCLGYNVQLVPCSTSLTSTTSLTEPSDLSATKVIQKIHTDTLKAKDNLNQAKISQAIQSNKTQTLTFLFEIGDRVRLSTLHRRHKFKGSGERCITKFMPRFNGPFKIIGTNEAMSTIKLKLPPNSKTHLVFHTSLVLPFKGNDPNLFSRHKFAKPQPIINETSNQEYFVKDIINEHRSGRRFKYLV